MRPPIGASIRTSGPRWRISCAKRPNSGRSATPGFGYSWLDRRSPQFVIPNVVRDLFFAGEYKKQVPRPNDTGLGMTKQRALQATRFGPRHRLYTGARRSADGAR